VLKRILGLFSLMSGSSDASNYEVGQVWSYKTRPEEDGSLVYILKIDVDQNAEKIFHIRVEGVRLRNPYVKGGIQSNLPHVVISETALKESLKRLVRVVSVLPDYSEGYGLWRKARDEGEEGVFSIPVSEVVEVIEKTVNEGQVTYAPRP
jgi:hypothetical protein